MLSQEGITLSLNFRVTAYFSYLCSFCKRFKGSWLFSGSLTLSVTVAVILGVWLLLFSV
jgi:hypothetical protein